ncbi:MAG: hypothetical protein LUH15_17510 [Tannerellaceae bacterium]|nr:hypothetical protein [Tannerellaceae bacterium]
MSNYDHLKSGVINYNLIEVLLYVQYSDNPEDGVDISEFQEILEDMYANHTNAKLIFRVTDLDIMLEYTPLISGISNSFPFIGAIATLQDLQTAELCLFYAERREEGVWFGCYYPLPLGTTSEPIKSMAQIKELIQNKRKN